MHLRIVPQALALTLLLAFSASASDVQFRSTAPLRDLSPASEESALQDALGRLLVRVTGRRAAADLVGNFPPASSIVRHYRVVDGKKLEAEFDEALIRRVLEEAGEGIWEGERPRLAVWLVISDGARWLYQPVRAVEPTSQSMDLRRVISGALGQAFEEATELRGIEIDFAPRADPASAEACAEELWVGFSACLPESADQLLVLGRVAAPSGLDDIEWNLREDGLWRMDWESDAAEAVHVVTDLLAARFMATQGPVRSYVLVVAPVEDLESYARLKAGLDDTRAVREWRIEGATGDSLTLRITSRTAEAPLRDALSSLGFPFELSRTGS